MKTTMSPPVSLRIQSVTNPEAIRAAKSRWRAGEPGPSEEVTRFERESERQMCGAITRPGKEERFLRRAQS